MCITVNLCERLVINVHECLEGGGMCVFKCV